MSDSKKPLKKEVVERRYNRRVFVESIISGRKLFYQKAEVDIIDAMKLAACYPGFEKIGDIMQKYDADQLKSMWLHGVMAEFSGPINRAVLSLADQYIGEEL